MTAASPNDEQMMELARRIGSESKKLARPNPWVGAVLLTPQGNVTTGATGEPGKAHAEITALDKAGTDARGATMWVTLEPCAHFGKTPPCVDRIIEAQLQRVVIGLIDPDHRVNGAGIAKLRDAGIEVVLGIGRRQNAEMLLPYLISRTWGRPLVTLKLAMTLDGYIAAADSSSNWISNAVSRARVHSIRSDHDAIVVGAGTIVHDNPRLDVRNDAGVRQVNSPRRVVLGTIPEDAAVLPALAWQGDVESLVAHLGAEGALSVMVEGGAKVAHSFLHASLVDQFHLFIAPKVLGGSSGVRLFEGDGAQSIIEALDFKLDRSLIHQGDVELILNSQAVYDLINSA